MVSRVGFVWRMLSDVDCKRWRREMSTESFATWTFANDDRFLVKRCESLSVVSERDSSCPPLANSEIP